MGPLQRLLLIALVGGAAPVVAQAGEPEGTASHATRHAARALQEKGLKLFRHADYAGARSLFEQASALVDVPEYTYNLAECARNLGDHQRAVELYRKFLATAPRKSTRERVEELLETEEKILVTQSEPPTETKPQKRAVASPPPPPASEPKRRHTVLYVALGAAAVLVVAALTIGLVVGLSSTTGTELGVHTLAPLARF